LPEKGHSLISGGNVNGIADNYKKVLGENYRTPEPSLHSKPEFRKSIQAPESGKIPSFIY
jgi:hypothetical protein